MASKALQGTLRLDDMRDLNVAISRCRYLLDLDADPVSIDEVLSQDTRLAPLVAAGPGRRVPRTVDPHEFAIRAVIGQQVSTAAARTHAARLVAAHGDEVVDTEGSLTHAFPTVESLCEMDPSSLAFPNSRRKTLTTLVKALRDGDVVLEIGSDWDEVRASLHQLPGFGPWTVESVTMRALGDPNAFLGNDLGVIKAASALGLPDKIALIRWSNKWSPWRAYAVQYLWAATPHAINEFPIESARRPA